MAIRAPDGANNLYLDIDMIASLSIGTWNWIGVYLWSCLCSNMSKHVLAWNLDWVISYALFHL